MPLFVGDRLYLDHAPGQVCLVHAAEGAVILIALSASQMALVVYHQHRDPGGSEGLKPFLEEADHIAGGLRVALQCRA